MLLSAATVQKHLRLNLLIFLKNFFCKHLEHVGVKVLSGSFLLRIFECLSAFGFNPVEDLWMIVPVS